MLCRDPTRTARPGRHQVNSRITLGAAALVAAVALAATPAVLAAPGVRLLKYSDGGVAVKYVTLDDGGSYKEYPDGGRIALQRQEPTCAPDAGALLELLARRDCAKDSDCTAFVPHVWSALQCCYAVRRDVVSSRAFDGAYHLFVEACPHAKLSCEEWCKSAVCRNKQCEVPEPPGAL